MLSVGLVKPKIFHKERECETSKILVVTLIPAIDEVTRRSQTGAKDSFSRNNPFQHSFERKNKVFGHKEINQQRIDLAICWFSKAKIFNFTKKGNVILQRILW